MSYRSIILVTMFFICACSDEVCKESAVIVSDLRTINFSVLQVEASRAVETTTSTLFQDGNKIAVTAIQHIGKSYDSDLSQPLVIMDNVNVTYSGGVWSYSPKAYWPIYDDEYATFYSHFPVSDDEYKGLRKIVSVSNSGTMSFNLERVSGKSIDQDVVYAVERDMTATSCGGTIFFDFKHLLSRLNFKLVLDSDDDNALIRINSIGLLNYKSSATYQNHYDLMEIVDGTANIDTVNLLPLLGSPLEIKDGEEIILESQLMLPQYINASSCEGYSPKIMLEYAVVGADEKEILKNVAYSLENSFDAWECGFSYNYKMIINKSTLRVEASVSDFKNGGDAELYPDYVIGNVFSEWPEYDNAPYYNFVEENSGTEWPEPTKIFDKGRYVSSTSAWDECMVVEDRRWAFVGGPVRRSTVTLEAVEPMLKEFNYQFDFLREKMGWPPIATEKDGYRNQIILHESGLRGQGRDTTAQGGWQSSFNGYPCVLMSYVPVQSFNPKYADSYQTGASIHEGIHAVFATLPGCKQAAWFHEGANTWLQAQLNIEMGIENGEFTYDDLQTDGEFGWLCTGSIMAPFMPIECYSGWLTTDNSFGGPAAQGNIDGLCTRSLLGGSQYSSVFPTFMSVAMSKYSVAKIWQEGFSGYILDRIEDFIGDEQMRRMVMEYRARLCLTDMNEWTGAVRNMYNANWGTSIGPERTEYAGTQKNWTAYPYVATTVDEEGWYNPDEYTLPGWTGANIIPFTVSGDTIAFKFEEVYEGEPLYEGTRSPAGSNLYREDGDTRFMICWNGEDGTPYYTEAFYHGQHVVIDITGKKPAHNVVFVMAVNTDYIYTGDKIRKAKYDFRVKPTYGISDKAAISKKWWNWNGRA